MKKSLAIAGASAVGVASLAGATPAVASDASTPCEVLFEHSGSAELTDDWYMDCVPQYGLGKAEFTISSDTDFPEGFLPLDDEGVTLENADGEAMLEYYVGELELPGIAELEEVAATPRERTYQAIMVHPVTGVGAVPVGDLPAECTAEGQVYSHAYYADFADVTHTFSQTVDDEEWVFEVESSLDRLVLAFQWDSEVGEVALDSDVCVIDGGEPVVFVPDDVPQIAQFAQTGEWNDHVEAFMFLTGYGVMNLGDFPRVLAAEPEPEEPTLPATGATDASGLLAGAGALLLAGFAALGGLSRRNRVLARRATTD